VAVATELNVHSARVMDLFKRGQYRREINLAFTKHQVLVHALTHVLNVDIP
jgi:hypothetical protein